MSINVKGFVKPNNEQQKPSTTSDYILNFPACLKILEEADDQEGMGYDYTTGARSGEDNDYDDEVGEDEFESIDYYQTSNSEVNVDTKKQNLISSVISVTPYKKGAKLKFQREINVSAYIEGLRKRVLTSLADNLANQKTSQQITKQRMQYAEDTFDKSQQLKKLVLAFEYAAPSLPHQCQRDNDVARQINHQPSSLHMRHLSFVGMHQTKQHYAWLKNLKEGAYDRLVERYYQIQNNDTMNKEAIMNVDESNWARPGENIGITMGPLNKQVESEEEAEWYFYSRYLKPQNGKPPAAVSRNENVAKGKSSQITNQKIMARSVLSRGMNMAQSSTMLNSKTGKSGNQLNKIEENDSDDQQYLIHGLSNLQAYQVISQDQNSDLIFLKDQKHGNLSQKRSSTTAAQNQFVAAVNMHLEQINQNEVGANNDGQCKESRTAKHHIDYAQHGGFKNTQRVKNQSFNKTLASMRKYQQLYQDKSNQRSIVQQQTQSKARKTQIEQNVPVTSDPQLNTDYSPSKDGESYFQCAENPQGPPRDPGDSLEQRLYYREQYEQQQQFGMDARDNSFQNNDDDESEHYPQLEYPILDVELASRFNLRQDDIVNLVQANITQQNAHKRQLTMQNRDLLIGERSSALILDQSTQRIVGAQSSKRKLGRQQLIQQQSNREGFEISKLNLFDLANQPESGLQLGQHGNTQNKGSSKTKFEANCQKRSQSLHSQVVVLGLQNINGGINQEGSGVLIGGIGIPNQLGIPIPPDRSNHSFVQNSLAPSHPCGNQGAGTAVAAPQIQRNGLELGQANGRGKPQIPFPTLASFASVSSPTGKNSSKPQSNFGQLNQNATGGRDTVQTTLNSQQQLGLAAIQNEQKFSKYGGNTKISWQNNGTKESRIWGVPSKNGNGSSTRLQLEQLQKLELPIQVTINDRNQQLSGLTTSASIFKNIRQTSLDGNQRENFSNSGNLHAGSLTVNNKSIQPSQQISSKIALGQFEEQPNCFERNKCGEHLQQHSTLGAKIGGGKYKHAARQIIVQQVICNYSQQQRNQGQVGMIGRVQSNQFVPLKKQSKQHHGSQVGPQPLVVPTATAFRPGQHVPRIAGRGRNTALPQDSFNIDGQCSQLESYAPSDDRQPPLTHAYNDQAILKRFSIELQQQQKPKAEFVSNIGNHQYQHKESAGLPLPILTIQKDLVQEQQNTKTQTIWPASRPRNNLVDGKLKQQQCELGNFGRQQYDDNTGGTSFIQLHNQEKTSASEEQAIIQQYRGRQGLVEQQHHQNDIKLGDNRQQRQSYSFVETLKTSNKDSNSKQQATQSIEVTKLSQKRLSIDQRREAQEEFRFDLIDNNSRQSDNRHAQLELNQQLIQIKEDLTPNKHQITYSRSSININNEDAKKDQQQNDRQQVMPSKRLPFGNSSRAGGQQQHLNNLTAEHLIDFNDRGGDNQAENFRELSQSRQQHVSSKKQPESINPQNLKIEKKVEQTQCGHRSNFRDGTMNAKKGSVYMMKDRNYNNTPGTQQQVGLSEYQFGFDLVGSIHQNQAEVLNKNPYLKNHNNKQQMIHGISSSPAQPQLSLTGSSIQNLQLQKGPLQQSNRQDNIPKRMAQTQYFNTNMKRKSQNLITNINHNQSLFEGGASPTMVGVVGFNPLNIEKQFSNYVFKSGSPTFAQNSKIMNHFGSSHKKKLKQL